LFLSSQSSGGSPSGIGAPVHYVEFASENYGDGNLADTNNNNLGNTPAERQRNQKLVDNNNQGYAEANST
jgi:hypothetical protein